MTWRISRGWVSILVAVASWGCGGESTTEGSDSGSRSDSGAIDSGTIDSGAIDSGSIDSGSIDSGSIDSGANDARADATLADVGATDAARRDAAGTDSGLDVDGGPDAGAPTDAASDAGSAPSDAGVADAHVSDAGPGDSGSRDSGAADAGSPDTGVMEPACDAPIPALRAVPVITSGLSNPIFVTQPPGSTDLYVAERGGRIRIVRGGAVLPTPFHDASGLFAATPSGDSEWGLLGLAFHPQYQTNGRFFIAYTPRGGGIIDVVAEGARDPSNRDRSTGAVTTVISTPDFAGNHNGGMIAFGPRDGLLYIAWGDGGSGCDPMEYGQNRGVLLGKILRIDVDSMSPYASPPDNPRATDSAFAPEVWAYGLRNPWRFSFDRQTGDIWIGDVGQNRREEVNVAPFDRAGVNYGWDTFEGTLACSYSCGGEPCGGPIMGAAHQAPIVDYDRSSGNTVIGGYVYRGTEIPALRGAYLFGDAYAGFVRALRRCGETIGVGPVEVPGLDIGATGGAGLVSFGEDQAGELYLVYLSGRIMRIEAQ